MTLVDQIKLLAPNPKEWMLVTQVEEELKEIMSPQVLRNIIFKKKIKTTKYLKRVYVNIQSLKDYLSN